MAALPTVVLLVLVAGFVLLAARWRPSLRPLEPSPPALDEVPIVAETGAPLHREESERAAAMREALLASGVIKRKEWAEIEPDLLFIPDDLEDAWLAERLTVVGGTMPDADEETGVGARERFHSLLVAQALTDRTELLGTFLAPGPFDVYRLRRPG